MVCRLALATLAFASLTSVGQDRQVIPDNTGLLAAEPYLCYGASPCLDFTAFYASISTTHGEDFASIWKTVFAPSSKYHHLFKFNVNSGTPVITVDYDGKVILGGGWTAEQGLAIVAGYLVDQENRQHAEQMKKERIAKNFGKPSSNWPLDISPEHHKALAAARVAWIKALGPGARVPSPPLRLGSPGACSGQEGKENAVACVHEGSIIDEGLQNVKPLERVTIYMHELGHLMGVPHIDGDKLMNIEFLGALAEPTKASVALARLHQ